MSLDRARELVLADARENRHNTGLSDADVLAAVADEVSLDQVVDYQDDNTEAWRIVLAHHQNPTRSQLCALIVAISGAEPELMPAHYRVWHQRILRGDLYQ